VDHRGLTWTTPLSVSRILAHRFGDAFFVPAAALERGHRVHAWTEALDLGQEPRPPEDIAGWCEAYRSFSRHMTPSWERIEAPFDSPKLGFHGIVDRVGSMRGHEVVADIKTGAPRAADAIQLAAYAMGLCEDWQACQRVGIYIGKDGGYKIKVYSDLSDGTTFLSLLKEALHGNRGSKPNTSRRPDDTERDPGPLGAADPDTGG
jgi:hypothetical protein